jgi:hypothetical protein
MQPVQCLPQLKHLLLLIDDDEAHRLLDTDLLLYVVIQEHRFDIHVVHLPPLVHHESDEQAHRVQPSHQLFSINKVRTNGLVISHLCGFTIIPLPLLSFFWVLFILSILILQMANTSNRVTANNAENNGENNNQDANPLPPPPLTLEQVLAM